MLQMFENLQLSWVDNKSTLPNIKEIPKRHNSTCRKKFLSKFYLKSYKEVTENWLMPNQRQIGMDLRQIFSIHLSIQTNKNNTVS